MNAWISQQLLRQTDLNPHVDAIPMREDREIIRTGRLHGTAVSHRLCSGASYLRKELRRKATVIRP